MSHRRLETGPQTVQSESTGPQCASSNVSGPESGSVRSKAPPQTGPPHSVSVRSTVPPTSSTRGKGPQVHRTAGTGGTDLSASDEEMRKETLDAFRTFDENGDGTIAREELNNILVNIGELPFPAEEVEQMLDEADVNVNGNGIINYEEYVNTWF